MPKSGLKWREQDYSDGLLGVNYGSGRRAPARHAAQGEFETGLEAAKFTGNRNRDPQVEYDLGHPTQSEEVGQ